MPVAFTNFFYTHTHTHTQVCNFRNSLYTLHVFSDEVHIYLSQLAGHCMASVWISPVNVRVCVCLCAHIFTIRELYCSTCIPDRLSCLVHLTANVWFIWVTCGNWVLFPAYAMAFKTSLSLQINNHILTRLFSDNQMHICTNQCHDKAWESLSL